jgi:hypothetical protein
VLADLCAVQATHLEYVVVHDTIKAQMGKTRHGDEDTVSLLDITLSHTRSIAYERKMRSSMLLNLTVCEDDVVLPSRFPDNATRRDILALRK